MAKQLTSLSDHNNEHNGLNGNHSLSFLRSSLRAPAEILPISERNCKSLKKVLGCALEDWPISVSVCEHGLGNRAELPLPLKMKPLKFWDSIYVYVESKLADVPKDPVVGFTEADLTETTGVQVYQSLKGRVCGDTFAIEALLRTVGDLSLCDRLMHMVRSIADAIRLDAAFLDAVNAGEVERRPARVH